PRSAWECRLGRSAAPARGSTRDVGDCIRTQSVGTRGRGLHVGMLMLGLLLPKTLLAAEPLPVRLSLLSSGPVYAGQAIEVQVAVTAGRTRPEVKVPNVEGAEVVAKKVMIKPLSSTTIGDLAGSQTNEFIFAYPLV